jgi:nucleotide-binding universal stress UspA family protein
VRPGSRALSVFLSGPAMKTILIPTEDHDAMPAVLEAALLVARAFGSYMEGVSVRPLAATYVTLEPVSGMAIAAADHGEAARAARAQFETFMRDNDVQEGAAEPTVLSYGWPRREPVDDSFIGSYGRVFDLIALGRPGPEPQNPRMAPLESALFESGRPALIVPAKTPATLGRNILIAWNGSTEQAHTNAFAKPLLRRAETVTVLTVEGSGTPGPSGEEAAQHLRRNGIKASAVTVKPGTRTTGEVILDHATSIGCDLLVKSAYTQSRLRQMIFGGGTRHILANAAVPVFMAH